MIFVINSNKISVGKDGQIMNEVCKDYWSDTCNRKEMAEAVAQGVKDHRLMQKNGPYIDTLSTKDLKNKSVVLIDSNGFWGDGQWLKYWEERMKAYGGMF